MFNDGVDKRTEQLFLCTNLPNKKKSLKNKVVFHFYFKEGVRIEVEREHFSVLSKVRQPIKDRIKRYKSNKVKSNQKECFLNREPDFSLPLYCFSINDTAKFINGSKLLRSRKTRTLPNGMYTNVIMGLEKESDIVDYFYNNLIKSQISIYFKEQHVQESNTQQYIIDIIENNHERYIEKSSFSTIEDLYKQVLFLAKTHYNECELWKYGVEYPQGLPQDLMPKKMYDIKFKFN